MKGMGKLWYKDSVFYQVYPLGFCGWPGRHPEKIQKLTGWIPHMKKLGVDAVYLGPVLESDSHGYDTRDYMKVDSRLGGNEDLQNVCGRLHDEGIRVILDGVFNHVGRGFWAFADVLEKKQASAYADWFHLDFGRDGGYGDGFWYEGWEGHYNLVRLNLNNPRVIEHICSAVRYWFEAFKIDGLRLDVAYLLPEGFLRELRNFTNGLDPDFFLMGETIHGDYNRLVNGQMLDSCTNYECYKGLYSSFNDENLFEIAYSLNRQFGPENWTLYKGKQLMCFLDNHDVSRIASSLKDERTLPLAYALLFTMPGIPCVYYGSEWGVKGEKTRGSDDNLRPSFEKPVENDLTRFISSLSSVRKANPALCRGDYKQLYLTNRQYAFLRSYEGASVTAAFNIEDRTHTVPLPAGNYTDLLTRKEISVRGGLELAPFTAAILGG